LGGFVADGAPGAVPFRLAILISVKAQGGQALVGVCASTGAAIAPRKVLGA
jgi:hypothetical protein